MLKAGDSVIISFKKDGINQVKAEYDQIKDGVLFITKARYMNQVQQGPGRTMLIPLDSILKIVVA